MSFTIPEGPALVALAVLAVAALAFSLQSFHLLYRDIRPKYRGRHRRSRTPTPGEGEPEAWMFREESELSPEPR